MINNNKKFDDLMIEFEKQEKLKNKELLISFWVLIITNLIFYLGIIMLASYTLGESLLYGVIVGISTFIMIAVAFYSLKIEVDAGYYECKNCKHRFVPEYLQALRAPHVFTNRYLKCPQCNNKTWSRKVCSKR